MADGLHAVISGDSSGYEAALKRATEATLKFDSSVKIAKRSSRNASSSMNDEWAVRLAASADKASKNLSQLSKYTDTAGIQIKNMADRAATGSGELDLLLQKVSVLSGAFDAVISSSDQYSGSISRATNANNTFTASANRANSASSGLSAAMGMKDVRQMSDAASESINTTSKSIKGFRNITQQAGYQLQDFIVQIQGGTSAFVAFGQQGSQMAGAFGPGGAIIGAVIALASAVGGILFNSFEKTEAKTESATDKIKRMTDVMESLNAEARANRLFELNDQLSTMGDEVDSARAALNKLLQEQQDLNETMDMSEGAWKRVTAAIKEQKNVLINAEAAYESVVGAIFRLDSANTKDANTKTNKSIPAIQSYLKNLREEVAVLGMSNVQKAIYTAQTKGATSAQLKEVEALSSKIQAYNDEVQADKERLKAKAALAQAAEAEHQAEMQRLAARASIFGSSDSEGTDDELKAEQAKNELKLAMLREYLKQEVIDKVEFNALKEMEEQRHMDALKEIKQTGMSSITDIVRTAYGEQAGLIAGALSDTVKSMSSNSKRAFEIQKKAALANAAVSGTMAAIDAWKSGMATPGPHAPLVAAAYTAASLAKTGALISQIQGQSYGGGSSGGSNAGGSSAGAGAVNSAEAQENRIANVTLVGDTFSRSSVEGLMEQLKEASDMGYKVNFG